MSAEAWAPSVVDLTGCGNVQPTWVEWVTTETVRIAVGAERAAHILSWSALNDLAAQRDIETATIYRRVRDVARRRMAAVEHVAALARIAACHEHVASTAVEHGYTGTAPGAESREHRAAHGNVTIVETCACGAERHTNVNGRHREQGDWS